MMLDQIFQTWFRGGWVMLPLASVSLLLFATGLRLVLRLRRLPDRWGDDMLWMQWLNEPAVAPAAVQQLLSYVLDDRPAPDQVRRRFSAIAATLLPGIDRQLTLLATLVAAAPLMGLLGTVHGMLVTFQALAANGAGGQVTEAVAGGISQALFPPEVGLCIALSGLLLLQWVKRRRHELEAYLARLESLTLQRLKYCAQSPLLTAPASRTEQTLATECVPIMA